MNTYRPTSEAYRGPPQQGLWQAFGKRGAAWVSIGNSTSQAEAEALVATLRVEGRLAEPHCVPL